MTIEPAMLVDLSICVGCDACTVACKQAYDLRWGLLRTRIDEVETGSYPHPVIVHTKKACMHCHEAACVLACPTGACHKRDDGLVNIDSRLCIGCNYCVANCTFGVVQYDQARHTAEKCSLCSSRIDRGSEPLCAAVCTARAVRYGDRAQLLAAGEQRVADLKKVGFAHASLYGKDEVGGLQVLMVLREPAASYGLPVEPRVPAGVYAWKYMSSPWGGAAAVLGLAALGFNFLHTRKMQSREEQNSVK